MSRQGSLVLDCFGLGRAAWLGLVSAGAGRAAWFGLGLGRGRQGSLVLAWFQQEQVGQLGLAWLGQVGQAWFLGFGLAGAGVKNKLLVDGIRERILTAIKFTSCKGLDWLGWGRQRAGLAWLGQVKGWLGLAGAGRARAGSLGFGLGR
ncbi:hypothetical protein BY996DRAFT_8507500 [Phakopsora pachyrhizi]|nr:hypothetical protein BY996DRAFT_8507500 [Phakopsora pachyrhizi]